MQAVLMTRYGAPDLLEVRDVPTPTPAEDQVLVKVRATSINAAEYRMISGRPAIFVRPAFGWRRPRPTILGTDVAGVVEAVGASVTDFAPGDAVVGNLFAFGRAAFAEYVCGPVQAFVHKPEAISFEVAAAIPAAGVTALQGLRDFANVQPGQQVLVHGASGGVGTFAVQLARHMGAEVTAVCSTRHVEMVQRLGAHKVVDYTQADVTQGAQRFDAICAINGYHSLRDYRRILKPQGVLAILGGDMGQIYQGLTLGRAYSRSGGQSVGVTHVSHSRDDMAYLVDLVASGAIEVILDACYPLADAATAIAFVERVHPRGKVVLTVSPPPVHDER